MPNRPQKIWEKRYEDIEAYEAEAVEAPEKDQGITAKEARKR